MRGIVADRLAELNAAGHADAPFRVVRNEFREVLYAHPQAAGYNAERFDPLFAAAFAQTLAFGLFLVREALDHPDGRDDGEAQPRGDGRRELIDHNAWQRMPTEHTLMRTTLRVLSLDEIVDDVGVGFDVILDTVNSFDPAILTRKPGGPDPILYFYEDFLQVFDPAARERYGVYYTPIEVVAYMVSALIARCARIWNGGIRRRSRHAARSRLRHRYVSAGRYRACSRVRRVRDGPRRGEGRFAGAGEQAVRIRAARRPLRGRALPTSTRARRAAGRSTGRRVS